MELVGLHDQCLPQSTNVRSTFLTDMLIRVGSQITKSSLSYSQRHPILPYKKDPLFILYIQIKQVSLLHVGPTLLLSYVGYTIHIVGIRKLEKRSCKSCVVCRKVAALTAKQRMGKLPAFLVFHDYRHRLFCIVLLGPHLTTCHHKCMYLCLSLFSCKAAHLVLVSHLTTKAFWQL